VLLALIVACEIGFWAFLLAGLAARYLLRWKTVSTILLICVPLVDLVLLAATIADLRGGGRRHVARPRRRLHRLLRRVWPQPRAVGRRPLRLPLRGRTTSRQATA
jgi:hypothetical protein